MEKVVTAGVWMPIFIKDHRAAASTMNHLEHSGYCYLLMLFWEKEGLVPDDDRTIARMLRMSVRQWKQIRPVVLADCTIANGVISHPATIAEVTKAKANIAQKKKAGMASAAARERQRASNGRSTGAQPYAGGGVGDGGGSSLASEKGFVRGGVSPEVIAFERLDEEDGQ